MACASMHGLNILTFITPDGKNGHVRAIHPCPSAKLLVFEFAVNIYGMSISYLRLTFKVLNF